MTTRDEVGAFLSACRARITAHEVGVRTYSRSRRMPGLSRSEVAALVGVSIDHYSQLEAGDLSGASDRLLEALSAALRLDEAQRAQLVHLARASALHPKAGQKPDLTQSA